MLPINTRAYIHYKCYMFVFNCTPCAHLLLKSNEEQQKKKEYKFVTSRKTKETN